MKAKIEVGYGPDEVPSLPRDDFELISRVEADVDLPGKWSWKIKRQKSGAVRLHGRLHPD